MVRSFIFFSILLFCETKGLRCEQINENSQIAVIFRPSLLLHRMGRAWWPTVIGVHALVLSSGQQMPITFKNVGVSKFISLDFCC
jgi:hypothetical protein